MGRDDGTVAREAPSRIVTRVAGLFLRRSQDPPTSSGRGDAENFPVRYESPRPPTGTMTEKFIFADVDLPFHVWVRESTPQGRRWVLREAPGRDREPRMPPRAPRDGDASAARPSR